MLRTPRPSYKIVKDIVAALEKEREEADSDDGAYLRGSDYYESLDIADDYPEEGDE